VLSSYRHVARPCDATGLAGGDASHPVATRLRAKSRKKIDYMTQIIDNIYFYAIEAN
jgi:hypothetical protein